MLVASNAILASFGTLLAKREYPSSLIEMEKLSTTSPSGDKIVARLSLSPRSNAAVSMPSLSLFFFIFSLFPTAEGSDSDVRCGVARSNRRAHVTILSGHARTQAWGDWTSTRSDNGTRKLGRRSRNYTPWNRSWKPTTSVAKGCHEPRLVSHSNCGSGRHNV